MKKIRNSNLELLRIVAMIAIVCHHFAMHSGFQYLTGVITIEKVWIQWLSIGGKFGVNLFMLISGYFLILSDNDLKFNRVAKLWGGVLFYSILFTFLDYLFNPHSNVGIKEFIKMLIPFSRSTWWFATSYFFVFLFHPFINVFLKSLNKENYIKFLVTVFIFICIITTLFGGSGFGVSGGTFWLFYLYSVAAYIRLHMVNYRNQKFLIFGVFLYLCIFAFIILFDCFSLFFPFFENKITMLISESNPIMFFCSIMVFIGFNNLKIKDNKFINLIASTTFGIYLIHDNKYVKVFLWKKLFNNIAFQDSLLIIPWSVFVIFLVFVCCSFIEFCRINTVDRIWENLNKKVSVNIDKLYNKIINYITKFI